MLRTFMVFLSSNWRNAVTTRVGCTIYEIYLLHYIVILYYCDCVFALIFSIMIRDFDLLCCTRPDIYGRNVYINFDNSFYNCISQLLPCVGFYCLLSSLCLVLFGCRSHLKSRGDNFEVRNFPLCTFRRHLDSHGPRSRRLGFCPCAVYVLCLPRVVALFIIHTRAFSVALLC